MRVRIVHDTVYRYERPVKALVQALKAHRHVKPVHEVGCVQPLGQRHEGVSPVREITVSGSPG